MSEIDCSDQIEKEVNLAVLAGLRETKDILDTVAKIRKAKRK